MAKSERAKALEAKQKEERKAAKLARKSSNDPKDWGTIRQLTESYKITKQVDPKLDWYVGAAFLIPFLLITILTFVLVDGWIGKVLWILLAIMTGLTAAMFVLMQRAKKGTFKRYAGQAGSAEVALSMLPSKKWFSTPGVAVTRSFDAVHRTLGPGGLFLIGDGEPGRLRALLASEKKKHDQILFGVETQVIQMGDKEGQVPLDKLTDHIRKMPKVLNATQINEVNNRLRSLDAMRPKAPIPKGYINPKGAHKAMRGR